jgi:hypothetical protein
LAVATPEPEQHPLRPSSIAGRGFSLVRKGYEPQEVHAFLTDVAEYVSRLQGEVEWLRARSEHLDRKTAAVQDAAYARLSRDFMDVVRRADEAATRVRLRAETKAQSDLVIAGRDAERILTEARLEAERILAAAKLEAHEIDWQAKVPEAHQARPAQTETSPGPEWAAPPEASGTDLPTLAVDIAAIWEVEDAASWPLQESLPPQLFEEPSAPIHIPDEWLANSPDMKRDAATEERSPADPEDLELHLDVSIFDLFDTPDD